MRLNVSFPARTSPYSCEFNFWRVEVHHVEVSYAKHGYVATRDIRKGEVIFSDYNTGEYSTPKNDQAFDCWHDFAKAK